MVDLDMWDDMPEQLMELVETAFNPLVVYEDTNVVLRASFRKLR